MELRKINNVLFLLDSYETIKLDDHFISLNDDESYCDVIEFNAIQSEGIKNFNDFTDSNWIKNCYRVIGYLPLDDSPFHRNEIPLLPPLRNSEKKTFNIEDIEKAFNAGRNFEEGYPFVKDSISLRKYLKSLVVDVTSPIRFIPWLDSPDVIGTKVSNNGDVTLIGIYEY